MDPLTTVAAGLTVLGSKDLITKVLGPTADYVGSEIRTLVERSNKNLGSIFSLALTKLGDRADSIGVVSPRVAKRVVDEGRFCDDELVAEYLGGVLASSKVNDDRDDRGVFYLNEISGLSAYQIRAHYLIYSSIVRSPKPYDQSLTHWYEQDTITAVVPEVEFAAGMEYSAYEALQDISHHAFLGLEMKGLCQGGTRVFVPDEQSDFKVPFRVIYPTKYGFDLFLWGLGLGAMRVSSYFDLDPQTELPLEPGFVPIKIDLGRYHYI